MWVAIPHSNDVVHLENGHRINIRTEVDAQGVRSWSVVSTIPTPGTQPVVIQEGYKTLEDAQADFVSLLSHLDITPFRADDPNAKTAEEKTEVDA
jgi:hypothetical protein